MSEPQEEEAMAQDLLGMNSTPLMLRVKKPVESITFSEMASVSRCPLQYCYLYALNIPVQPTTPVAQAKVLSSCINHFLERKSKQEDMKWEELESKFRSEWTKELGDQETDLEQNKATLESFFNNQAETTTEEGTFTIGKPFSFDFDGVRVGGSFERIDHSPKGDVLRLFTSSIEKGQKIPPKVRKQEKNNETLFNSWAFKKVFGAHPLKVVRETLDMSAGRLAPVTGKIGVD